MERASRHSRESALNGTAGMKWPLIGSAAGHLALAAVLLLVRFGPGPARPVAVIVDLVEPSRAAAPGKAAFAPATVKGAGRLEEIRVEPAPHTENHGGVRPPDGAPRGPIESPASAPAGPLAASPLALPSRVSVEASFAGPAAAKRSGGAERGGALLAGETAQKTRGGEGHEVRLLRERIESRIAYPEEAVRRGQEGEVLLRIRVAEGGIPGEIRIARSSGARSLDEAARKGVASAAPLPSSPGWFEVPVRFFLR